MYTLNENYLKLPGSYLFSGIAKKVAAYQNAHKDADIIRLGIGDVTQPLCKAVIDELHKAVDEMASADTFKGYAPDLGYEFLRHAMAQNDYRDRGCDIGDDEIFISDGAKSDSANIQEIFGQSCRIAVCDPVYPVYVDSNVMAGRCGDYDEATSMWSNVIYMPCTADNGFVPQIPKETPDLIYLCFPNNPTGEVISKEALQTWVDYANKVGAIIIYDAAYEAYITDSSIPHSIYECDGARKCAIELRSFSKNAGFTGLRLGATIIPHDIVVAKTAIGKENVELHSLYARRHGTKYNGAPYIVQRAGYACYTEEGKAQIDATFTSCILRTSAPDGYQYMFNNCIFEEPANQDYSPENSFVLFDTHDFFYDFTPKENTLPISKANGEFTLPIDRKGNERISDQTHDIGCFETVKKY